MKFYFTLFFTLAITIGYFQNLSAAEKQKPIDKANMNLSANPAEDFFEYANGGWMKKNLPIPDEYSIYGAFTQLQEDNYKNLRSLVEAVSKKTNSTKGSIEQLIGDYYAAGMDDAKINGLGFQPIKQYLKDIDNCYDREALMKAIIEMYKMGLGNLFSLYAAQDETNSNMVIANLYQGGLGMGDRDYYLSADKRSEELKEAYVNHIQKMFELIKYESPVARKTAIDIFAFEKKMAQASRTRVDLRDPQKNYNKMPIDQLIKSSPDFNWRLFFYELGIKKTDEINVGQPEFFENISKMMNEDIKVFKEYLKWHILNSTSDYLSQEFVDEHFNFYGKVFTGKQKNQERWKRILNQTNGDLGEAVGQIYVKEFFPPEAKQKMLKLVENLRVALGQRISKLDWMSAPTKKEAAAKLAGINVKIGYPDKWIDYSSIDISRESYLQNSINATKFNYNRELAKIGNPPDRQDWGMTPQTVNAYYSPNMNEIVFPAAILQPPFFFLEADDAVNYAAIGTVIGHEMTHGFDDQGRQYDKEGNLKDWWQASDAEKFTKRVSSLVKQYDSFVAIEDQHVNGELTLGENIADVGGLTVSFTAWKNANGGKVPTEKIDGFLPIERFFLSYAQVWRNNIRDKELLRRLKEDVHSPGRFRVNGALPNIPEFYSTFGIKKGDKLYLPEEERAKIW
jgi:putative endopeptidase